MSDPDSWNATTAAGKTGDDRGDASTDPGGERTSAAALARVERLRVLAIDGNAARLDALHRALGRMGIDAHVGDVGGEGYRLAMNLRPDVVLSDLTTPGEPGWWLFQRFRRQPLMRWTPVLLMRWWEESLGGRERVMTAKVVERLAEALAPVRVLEERVTAGRFTGDRVELTGIPLLLEVMANARLSGCFSVNDSWNVFECRFEVGRAFSVIRRGVDGEVDSGDTAFMQMVLCESGRWSFRLPDGERTEPNLEGTVGECLDRAARTVGGFFGPDARSDRDAAAVLDIRLSLVREVAESLGGGGRQLLDALAAGASPVEVESLINNEGDVITAERAMVALLRNGAVVPGKTRAGDGREPEHHPVARAVAALAGVIAGDHSCPGPTQRLAGEPPRSSRQETGYYRVEPIVAEKVAARAREGLIVPGARTSVTDDLAPAAGERTSSPPPDRPTPVVSPSPEARDVFLGDAGHPQRHSRPMVLPRESLVPPPEIDMDREQGRSQMWLAILLALVLGLLVLGGVWLLSGDLFRPPAPFDP